MCFSATASFAASGGLVALGGASFIVAKKEDKILAAIPFLFGIQQAFEGIQWLYLNNGSSSLIAGYCFLFIAFIIWPIYVPTIIFILDEKRQKLLKWFIFLGIIIAFYSIGVPFTQSLLIHKQEMCVAYTFNYPFKGFVTIAYLVAIFGPFFVSSREVFKWFGVAFAILAIIAWIFFKFNFVSVWCFFAAIVSSMFFVYIKFKNRTVKI